jgi:EF hand
MVIALALGLPACSLLAQNDGPPADGPGNRPPGGHRHGPPMMPLIMALDANHDGVISADEIANAAVALKTLDKNGDGQLTKDEYMPHPPRRPGGPQDGAQEGPKDGPPPGDGPKGPDGEGPHKRPVPPIVAALDTNGDGVISADEIAAAPTSLLKLDKNGDGKLTFDELRPPRPPQGDGGPDGPGEGQRPPPPGQNN